MLHARAGRLSNFFPAFLSRQLCSLCSATSLTTTTAADVTTTAFKLATPAAKSATPDNLAAVKLDDGLKFRDGFKNVLVTRAWVSGGAKKLRRKKSDRAKVRKKV